MAGTGLGASEGFGGSQLRRLFLPGLIAAAGLHAYFPARVLAGIGKSLELSQNLVFIVEVIIYGFLLSSGAKPIFYLYEGFLAPWLTSMAGAWNRRKVQRLQIELGRLYEQQKTDSPRAAEIL